MRTEIQWSWFIFTAFKLKYGLSWQAENVWQEECVIAWLDENMKKNVYKR